MSSFSSPTDLIFNRGPVTDPDALARESGAASWLFLCGEEFASMDGGLAYSSVQGAIQTCDRVISDPPRVVDMDLAQRQIAALDRLPRPTLVTCRKGPRSSALVYLYSGLQAGATADEVLAVGAADDAPFMQSDELKAWVTEGLSQLSLS